MNTSASELHRHSRHAAFAISFLALAGCAHTTERELSWDSYNGVSGHDSNAYLQCVSSKVTPGLQTFISTHDGSGQLLVGSADPRQANGVVEVKSMPGGSHFTAYEHAAWQDKGELLDAAYRCSLG